MVTNCMPITVSRMPSSTIGRPASGTPRNRRSKPSQPVMSRPAGGRQQAGDAEDVDRPGRIQREELHRHQVEQHPHGARDAVLRHAGDARPVVDRQLDDPAAEVVDQRGDEAVHLAVQAQAARQVAADELQRAAVVVQAHAGDGADQPVGEPRRHAPAQPGVLRARRASRRPGRSPPAAARAGAGCRPDRSAGRRR